MTDEDCRHTVPSNKSISIAPRRRRLTDKPDERRNFLSRAHD
jgi:hypothetical protein